VKVPGKPLKVEVREMSSQGLLTLRYSEKIGNRSVINDTVMSIWVKDNPESLGNKTILSWNMTAIRDKEQDIQLNFSSPGDISYGKVSLFYA